MFVVIFRGLFASPIKLIISGRTLQSARRNWIRLPREEEKIGAAHSWQSRRDADTSNLQLNIERATISTELSLDYLSVLFILPRREAFLRPIRQEMPISGSPSRPITSHSPPPFESWKEGLGPSAPSYRRSSSHLIK